MDHCGSDGTASSDRCATSRHGAPPSPHPAIAAALAAIHLAEQAASVGDTVALEKALADGGPYVIVIEVPTDSEVTPWTFIHPAKNN